jgi:ribosomal protein S18 acetylase RimI-like enzyme
VACILSIPETELSKRCFLIGEAAAIFWETANTRSFETLAARDAYYRRWFERYLETEPERFFLAFEGSGSVAGYLACCSDTFSDAAQHIAGDISFYTPSFRAALCRYPSHFHINVKPGLQGAGVGRRLVERLVQTLGEAGAPGIHVVTGAQSRAVQFYEACGFRRVTIAQTDPSIAVLVLPLLRREAGKS